MNFTLWRFELSGQEFNQMLVRFAIHRRRSDEDFYAIIGYWAKGIFRRLGLNLAGQYQLIILPAVKHG